LEYGIAPQVRDLKNIWLCDGVGVDVGIGDGIVVGLTGVPTPR
jgi:hypothetical protein